MPELQNTSPSGDAMSTQGTPATGTPATPGATPGTAPSTLEEAMARIAELERHSTNKEEQASRHGKDLAAAQKRLADYEAKERQAQEATLSEIEKANKARTEAEQKAQQYQKQLVTAHIKLAAKEKGARNPDVVASHIAGMLEYDKDTGLPTNLEKVLEDLSKSDQYLFVEASPAGQQQPQRPTPQFTPNSPARSQIVQPGQAPQGKRPSLFDDGLWKK